MNRSRLLMLALAAVVIVTAAAPRSAHAQAGPFPGAVNIDGGWVPCSHRLAIDAGRGCVAPSPGVPPSTLPAPDDAALVCDPMPNPYTEPEKVIACNARPSAPDAVPTFLLGHVYAFGYGQVRARIVSLGTDADGTQVVTVRWLSDDAGAATSDAPLRAFRTPPTPGAASLWRLVGGPR
jgi:hypothetical protein